MSDRRIPYRSGALEQINLTIFGIELATARAFLEITRSAGFPDRNVAFVTAASLIPNFDFVAIRVGDVGVGVAWAEFASPEQLTAGLLDFVDGRVDVAGGDM